MGSEFVSLFHPLDARFNSGLTITMNDNTMHDLLLTCLHRTPINSQNALIELEPAQWAELVALAANQGVAPLLYHRIKAHNLTVMLPRQAMATLQRAHHTNAIRNVKLYQELVQLLKNLQAHNIPVIVLKGAYLAQAVYQNPAWRFMVDVDIMVHEADLPAAIEVVTATGYRPAQPVRLESKAVLHHLPGFLKDNDAALLEIHWTITQPNRPYTIEKVDELWTRAQPFRLLGVEALTLCPEDLLLHLCVHAAYHHLFKMGVRPLYDIALTIDHFRAELDWEAVCQRSVEWGWERGVYLTLHLCNTLLGAAIPPHVLETLKPAEVPPQLVETAKAYLFMPDDELDDTISNNFMRMVGDRPLMDKARLLIKRLLISRRELANAYGVPLDSPRLYLYYPVRLADFLTNCSQQVWRYLTGETTFKRDADQRNRLINWMEQA